MMLSSEAVELRFIVVDRRGEFVALAFWVPKRTEEVRNGRTVTVFGKLLKTRTSPDRLLAYPFRSRSQALSVASGVEGSVLSVPYCGPLAGVSCAI